MKDNKKERLVKEGKGITVLFVLSVISFIFLIAYSFWYNANIDYLNYDQGKIATLTMFASVFVFLVLSIIWYINISSVNKREDKDWLDISFSENNIHYENIKFALKSNSFQKIQLIYTKDKKLFYVNIDTKTIKEIEFNDILKIDIECAFMERNQRRIVALTTTYDNIKSITEVVFKIITDSEIYSIKLDISKEAIDISNQFKLILDRDIELLNR